MTAQVIDLFSRRSPVELARPVQVDFSPHRFTEDELVSKFLSLKTATTADNYRRDLKHYRKWLSEDSGHGIDLYEAEEWHVGDWKTYMLETLEWENSTVRRRMSAVGGMYEWALRSNLHTRNPEWAVDRPKVGDNVQYTGLDLVDLKELAHQARLRPVRTTAVVSTLMTTGIRVSELCNACIEGLVRVGPKVMLRVVRKGGKPDLVEIPEGTHRALLASFNGRTSGPLILGERGKAISRHVVWRMIRTLGDEALPHLAGKLHPHDLRHSFVSLVLLLTRDVRIGRDRAGHKDINHTLRYWHALEGVASTEVADLEATLGFLC
ncbi:tyrosine-type recombinase/integrase [Streptomyces sp. NPDC017448]|uniref:tyrosine-type recombinase/integrase n=1 Tax=Streptomyces sp. NPDC017448 TaxID=3364996 RepID=UPI0037A987BB